MDLDIDAPFDGVSATAAQAEGLGRHASPFCFTLAAVQQVRFQIDDSDDSDNIGAISISVTAVPEPETWVMLLGGLALIGAWPRGSRRHNAP